MNLLEGMMAAVLFCGSVSASLQLWGLTAVATARHQQRQGLQDRVEAELLLMEQRLRREAAALPTSVSCEGAADALVARLRAAPAAEDLRREVLRSERWVEVRVDAVGGDRPRRRLYSPAAFSLCGEASEAEGRG